MGLCAGSLSRATLREQTLLELQYDGPVPPYALSDLRRMTPTPMVLNRLSDVELSRWLALAHSNLKAEQRNLAAARRFNNPGFKRWRMAQCIAARSEWRALKAEQQARAPIDAAC